MQEKRCNFPLIPMKRSATDPPSLFQYHQQQQLPHDQASGIRPDSPEVCQEETLNLSSSSEITVPTTSTPKTPLSSPDHFHPVQHMDEECTPIAQVQPNRSYIQKSPEPFVPERRSYPVSTPPPSSYCDPSTAQGPRRSSRSATVSRESSFRSLYSSASSSHQSSSLADTISHVANTAIHAITQVSQGLPSGDRYMSSSSFATKQSARCNTDSDTRSAHSESEGTPIRKIRNKGKSLQSSYQRQRRKKSTQKYQDSPHDIQRNSSVIEQYAASSSEYEAAEFEMSDAPSYESGNEDDEAGTQLTFPVTLRKKATQRTSTPRRHSTMDATPRPVVASADNRRFSYNIPDSFKRQSVASDATSEATITTPRSSDFGRGMCRALSLCKLC